MLQVRGLSVHYGRVRALHDVSLDVGTGEIVALIGANGAGKSTLVNALSGLVRTSAGEVRFDGRRIDRLGPTGVVRAGIVQVAEGRQLFPGLTIGENLRMGAYTVTSRAEIAAALGRVFTTFPVLAERQRSLAQTLSGGEQQMLAIGRALMSRPRMLVLDEPTLGLAPLFVERILEVVATLHRQGLPILMIEQNVPLSLRISERAYVLERGRVARSGSSLELLHDPYVEAAYLGV